jgi:hypothetical protein
VSTTNSSIDPQPGLVIRYAYLWRDEEARGLEQGKDRPCAVVLAVRRAPGDRPTVVVAPITHSPPPISDLAIELPAETKARLGLDDARSWIKTNDLNVFLWPGPDLRPVQRTDGSRGFVYGLLPAKLTVDLINRVRAQLQGKATKPVTRQP